MMATKSTTTLEELARQRDAATERADAAIAERDELLAVDQIRNTQRAIDVLELAQRLVVSGISATHETDVAMSAISRAREVLRDKRDRELDERLTWQRRDWLATDLVGAKGDTQQRRYSSTR